MRCKDTPHYRWRVVGHGMLYLDNRRGYSQPLVKALQVMAVILQTHTVKEDELKQLRAYVHLKVQRYEQVHGWLYKYFFARNLEETKKILEKVIAQKLQEVSKPPGSADSIELEVEGKPVVTEAAPIVDEFSIAGDMGLEGNPITMEASATVDWSSILVDIEKVKSQLQESCTLPKYLSDGFLFWDAVISNTTISQLATKIANIVVKYINNSSNLNFIEKIIEKIIQCRWNINRWFQARGVPTCNYTETVSVQKEDPLQIGSYNNFFFTLISMLAGQVERYQDAPIFSDQYIGHFKAVDEKRLIEVFSQKKNTSVEAENKLLDWLRLVDQWLFSVVDAQEEDQINNQLERDRQFVGELNKTWLNTVAKVLYIGERVVKSLIKNFLFLNPVDLIQEENSVLENNRIKLLKIRNCIQGLEKSTSLYEGLQCAIAYGPELQDYWEKMGEHVSKEYAIQWLRQHEASVISHINNASKMIQSKEFQELSEAFKTFHQHIIRPIFLATIDQHQMYYLVYALTLYRDAVQLRVLWYEERLSMQRGEVEAQKAYERSCKIGHQSLIRIKKKELEDYRRIGTAAVQKREASYEAAKEAFYPPFLKAIKTLYLELEKNPLIQQFLSELDRALPKYSLPKQSYDFSNDLFNRVIIPILEKMIGIPSFLPRTISE